MYSINQARTILGAFAKHGCTSPSREDVVAYAMICALVEHFPTRAQSKDKDLLEQCKVILEKEPDRFYKQRRIALAKLVETKSSAMPL